MGGFLHAILYEVMLQKGFRFALFWVGKIILLF